MYKSGSIALIAGLFAARLLMADPLLREDMHPDIYNYPKPLVCQFYTGPADNRVWGEKFILTWAQIVEIDKYTMTFRKDGKDYIVPAGSNYICNALAG